MVMDFRDKEKALIHTMNQGFHRAAASFCHLINRPVKIFNGQSLLIHQDVDFSYVSEEEGDLFILITDIIGDISGKSFLIFNEEESNEIFKVLSSSMANDAFKKAFLMEIDNIISASVISELSNALEVEIYGDVPHLSVVHARDLQEFMSKEICKDTPSSFIFCNTMFLFDNKEHVHPQFVWKLSDKVYDLILARK